MKTRRLLKKFILMLLMVAIIAPITQPITVYAVIPPHITRNKQHPSNRVDYNDNEVEAKILAEQKEAGSKNDFIFNYYTIREMVLNDEYDSEILSKKYQAMDEFFRFYAQFDNDHPFFDTESREIVEKVGIIDKIYELEDGSVVFTLTDNPKKRFLIMQGYDYFHFRYVTKPGDKVRLLTTTDRVVYQFDNYNLTRGYNVNYSGYMNYRHPEDMVKYGYFPSKLYQERLEEKKINVESWLQLMLEYVDTEEEDYNGYADYICGTINPEERLSVDEYLEAQHVFSSTAEYLNNDLEGYQNSTVRKSAEGFDYDSVGENLLFTYGEIREIKTNSNGETVFTLWSEPTRWYYISKYYDPLHLAEITKSGDEVCVFHTDDKIVYGFNNGTIFEDPSVPFINNPNFLDETYTSISIKEFCNRIGELSEKEQQKYEELIIFFKKIKD